ncbi:hypothetical protein ACO0R3_002700 [Hanseniaspora guilliermondii]
MAGDPIEKLRIKLINDPNTHSVLKEDFLFSLIQFKALIEFAKVQTKTENSPYFSRNLADVLKNYNDMADIAYQYKIHEQYQHSYTYDPESFTTSCMLYIPIKINNVPILAFVDSGAEKSILSSDFLEGLKLDKMLDKRFVGQARGVGTSNITGRLHHVMLTFDNEFLPHSLTVLDSLGSAVLIGLDFMRKYKCIIDFNTNSFKITGLDVEIKFLNEGQVERYSNKILTEEQFNDIISSDDSNGKKRIQKEENTDDKEQKKIKTHESTELSKEEKTNDAFIVNEQHVNQLIELGFDKSKVIEALKLTNNDLDKAAELLLTL